MTKKRVLKNVMHNYAKVISFLEGAVGCTIGKTESGSECLVILCESQESADKLKLVIGQKFGTIPVELRLKEVVGVKGV